MSQHEEDRGLSPERIHKPIDDLGRQPVPSASLLEAALTASAAVGVVIGKIGTAAATRDEIREPLPAAITARQEHP